MKTLKTFLNEAPEKTLKIEPLSAIRLLIDYYVHVYSPKKIKEDLENRGIEDEYAKNFKDFFYDEWYENFEDKEDMEEYLEDSGNDPDKDWEEVFADMNDYEDGWNPYETPIKDLLSSIDDTYHPLVQCYLGDIFGGQVQPMEPRHFSPEDQIEHELGEGRVDTGDYVNDDGFKICFNAFKNGPGQMKSAVKEAILKVEKDKAWKMVPLKALVEGIETLWLKQEPLTPSAGLGKLLTDAKFGVAMDKKELNMLNTKGLDKYDIEWAKNFTKEYKRFL